MTIAAVPTDRILPWNDPVLDAVAFVLVVLTAAVGVLWWEGRKKTAAVPDPLGLSEPLSHVRPAGQSPNLDVNGRMLKVGVDTHMKACDAGDKIECVCPMGDDQIGGAA